MLLAAAELLNHTLLLGIALLDHVIIGASGYYSFLDSGLLG